MSRKILFVFAALAIVVLGYIIITNDTISTENRSIVLVGYSKYSQKWIDIKEGALSAAQKRNINMTAVACDSVHAVADQIQLIEQAIEEKPDAIIIMPTDLVELAATIEKVYQNNIDLIIIDNYQQSGERAIPRVGTDASDIAQNIAEDISNSSQDEIKIGCIFSYDDNGKSFSIYNEFVKKAEEYENIKIVADTVSAIDENVASAEAEILLNTYSVDYIVCFEETLTKGACEYLSKQKEANANPSKKNIKVIGIGLIDDCAVFLEDNIIYSLGVQSYYNMGYLSVQSYADTLLADVFTAHYIIHKDELNNEKFQKILFKID